MIIATRDLFDDPFRTDTIAEQCIDLTLVKNQAMAIDSVYRTYAYELVPEYDRQFRDRSTKITQEWNMLRNLVADINQDPTKTYRIPQLESLSYGTPILNFRINPVTPAWGGGGGDPFQGVTHRSVLHETRVSRIVMRGAKWVDKLELTYASDTGNTTSTHGGDGGNPSSPFNLQKGEFIVQISGTAGTFVNQLSFKTNFDQRFTWPPGPEGATAFPTWDRGKSEE